MTYFKKISFVFLLVSFNSFAVIDLRIQGGLNLSDEIYSGDEKLPDSYKKRMHIGFNAGARTDIYFTRQLGAAAGLSFETRGSGWKDENRSADFSMNYLQIPLFFSYSPLNALTIAIGPELGIFLAGKTKVGNETWDLDEIKPIDLGASIVVDYCFMNMIAVGGGYYLGFLNNDDRPRGDFWDGSIRNTNIKLYMAYIFHLKR